MRTVLLLVALLGFSPTAFGYYYPAITGLGPFQLGMRSSSIKSLETKVHAKLVAKLAKGDSIRYAFSYKQFPLAYGSAYVFLFANKKYGLDEIDVLGGVGADNKCHNEQIIDYLTARFGEPLFGKLSLGWIGQKEEVLTLSRTPKKAAQIGVGNCYELRLMTKKRSAKENPPPSW